MTAKKRDLFIEESVFQGADNLIEPGLNFDQVYYHAVLFGDWPLPGNSDAKLRSMRPDVISEDFVVALRAPIGMAKLQTGGKSDLARQQNTRRT